MKRLRLIIVLLLLPPVLLFSWLAMTPNGLQWLYHQSELYLPAELSFDQLQGKLIGPVTLSGLEYQQDGVHFKADQLVVDWLPGALLAANININQLHIKSLTIDLPVTATTEQTPSQADRQTIVLPEISLPWRLLLKNAEIDGLTINQGDETFHLKKVELNASSLFSRVNIKKLGITGDTFSIDIRGKLRPTGNYSHDLDLDWQAELPSTALIKGQGKLAGNMKTSRIKQQLSGPLKLSVDARVNDVLNQLTWLAKINVAQFDVTKLDPDLPALSGALKLDAKGDLSSASVSGNIQGKHPETGKLDANFNLLTPDYTTVHIEQLKLHAAETDTHIETSGFWTPATNGGDIKLVLNWQNLRWPLLEPPWFNSANGSGSIEGNIDQYQITLNSSSPWPQAAPSSWHASATGNLDGMTIKTLRVNAMNGEANASGQLNWSPQLSWQAQGSVSNINPATLLPQWPGRLKGKLTSNARMENGLLVIEADISQINGTLRNYPVNLRSRLSWSDNQLHISQLNFNSGESSLNLQGQLGDTLKLNWSINSSDLTELYPQAKGQLQAHGKLSGPIDTPKIETSVNGKNLAYLNYEIAAVEGSLAVDMYKWQQTDINLAAKTLKLNNYELQSLDINAGEQNIQIKAASKRVSTHIELEGKADADGWRGHIKLADIKSEYFDNWQLKAPVAVAADETTLQADKFCWHSNQQAELCVSVKRENTAWLSNIMMHKVPLKIFERWLPPELKLEGTANAIAELALKSPEQLIDQQLMDQQLLAQVNIDLPSGAMRFPMLSGEVERRVYRSGNIKITVNSQGLDSSAELTMDNDDQFRGSFALPGTNLLTAELAKQPMKASARIRVKDLRFIETIIPEIYNLQGELKIDLSASGTLQQPVPVVSATIDNGAVQIPRLGLNIEQLKVNAESVAANKLRFRLDARSGDGTLAVYGQTQLDRTAGWPTEINIKGDQFEAARIPEARLQVSPDIQIKLINRTIDIKGKVHIPYAKLQPKDITQAKNVSSDTVIIGGEQAAEETWLINTSVRLTLGERVHFYGFGFEGRLGGSLLLQDEPGQLTRATGEITIPEGIYRAYGQRLEVENGRILYTGGPLTNPGLDVRAVRKVNNVTAGIHVKGSLNQPRLEIFSSPAMGQTDALAYILLGGPIENASNEDGAMMAKAALALGLSGGDTIARSLGDRFGLDEMRIESSEKGDQAALVVGRYLSPKLYASYGVGLIESINTLTLRYQVSNKWQIKAESGNYQGADILYTIER